MGLFGSLFAGDTSALAEGGVQPSFGERIGDGLSSPLGQIGLQLIGNHGTNAMQRGAFEGVDSAAYKGAVYGAAKREKAEDKAKQASTLAWLQENRPDLADMVNAGLSPGEAFKAAIQQQQFDAEQARLNKGPGLTDDMREYQFAKEDPGFATFLGRGKAPNIESYFDPVTGAERKGYWDPSIGEMVPVGGSKAPTDEGAAKAPSGFQWDPSDPTRLTPIPGGPGEQISAEVAGRIGIANSFIKTLPKIRERVAEGQVTGPVDAMLGRTGFGQSGQLYSDIESGVDALQRMLTGAGQNESEARSYARRYAPSTTDNVETLNYKLNRLETELNEQMNVVLRGRGGNPNATPSATSPAASGTQNYRSKYGLE